MKLQTFILYVFYEVVVPSITINALFVQLFSWASDQFSK